MDQRLSTKRGFLSAPGARLAAAAAFALSVFASAPASASPSYPEAVQEFFAIAATPSCKLCHATDDGGPGRLNNSVGMYVRYDLGLEAGAGADAVRAALFRWNDRHDADADGVADLQELMGGADPNVEGEGREAEPTPAEASGSSGASSDEPDETDEPRFQVRPGQKMGGCSYADVAAAGGAREALLLALAALARRLAAKRRAKRALGRAGRPGGRRGGRGRPAERGAGDYGRLAPLVRVVCVTGTNGKTSTTSMVAAVAAAAGLTTARITTVGSWVGDEPIAAEVSVEAYAATLRRAAERGAEAFAIEVTSQALAAGFAPPWPVDVAVFTNLTHDHLDYHKTMEAYLAAKARLFVGLGASAVAVFNAADEASALLDEVTPPGVRRCWYAARPADPACAAARLDLRAAALRPHRAGTQIALAPSPLADALGGELSTPLVGAPFAENALAAACAGAALGLEPAAIRRGLASMRPVSGRFEIVIERPLVVVDYAHTPDALARVLQSARALVAGEGGRVACVFGCGGGRDAEKRPIMGRAAADAADLVIVTSDNPRHEDPAAIADAVEAGARGGAARVRRELDRAAAIAQAIAWAGPDDAVIIAGKGHERQQDLGGRALPFDDGEVARRAHRALP